MTWPIFDFGSAPPYQQLFDYTGTTDGQPVFIGWSTPGVSTSDFKWKIRKLTYTTIVVGGENLTVISQIQYANGDVGFNQVWDPAGGLLYAGGATFR